ncbi:hypothetical protein E1B28_009917 [Marasmius oreades]|uniref:Uncharacterized protein n=1 Tax=Marasmius oreades TaxID=181124 RepID=A0A9P7RWS6_9AGAR|nr:uncharacterized protein E1B28_009917 [Marasmius oreades]KAG7090835.1 hypothetical protein E1B28_009917 [Marasmius oreades]
MTEQTRPEPLRQQSLDQSTLQKLEKHLNERPDKRDLVYRNIMKEDQGIAPGLVQAKIQLQRSQLEDKLDHALQQRPKPEELVKEGILHADEAPPTNT